MNLYFDTNIYRFITERDETRRVAALLKYFGCRLLVSAGNLFETYAVKSFANRAKEVETIVQLGSRYQSPPESYLHALEVRREVKRLRPKWINTFPRRKNERFFLKGHLKRWAEAKAGMLPPDSAFKLYSRDAENGIATIKQTQKRVRASSRKAISEFRVQMPAGQIVPVDLEDPEIYWRTEGLLAWHQAIEMKSPASRDYADWLAPHLRPKSFADPSYYTFWLNEVSADAMPYNRLTGLVSYYQLRQKITHGNAADQIHSSCWLLSDLFITADRGFHEALSSAARHYPGQPLPVLANRDSPSFALQLEQILTARGTLPREWAH